MTKPSIAPADLYRKLPTTIGDNKMNRCEFRIKPLVSIILLTLCIRHPALAFPGDLDTSFAGSGKTSIGFAGNRLNNANAVAIQGAQIVVAGDASGSSSHDFGLVRLNAVGTIDTTFGNGGAVTTDFSNNSDDSAKAVAIQADGKIVVAGRSGSDFALARYLANGILDSAFGTGGKVTTDLGGVDGATAVAIQADGRIVVAGVSGSDFALVRYLANGILDSTFGIGSKVITDFGGVDGATAVAIQADGRIVVAGVSGSNFALARYNTNGILDPTFSGDGKQITDFGGTDFAAGEAIQADGRIVVVGGNGTDFALARYNPDGSLDPTFSGDGKQTTDFGGADFAAAVAIQADGKIVAVGDTEGLTTVFAVARYNSNGALDLTFSGDGKLTTSIAGPGVCPTDFAHAVAIQKSNGRIVVAGISEDACAESTGASVARYHAFECGGQNVTILGTAGNDILNGTSKSDVIDGLGGDDIIHGGDGVDIICGGDGNDSLFGDSGNDTLFGQAGINTLDGGLGTDTGVGRTGDTFVSCEITNVGGSGVSGVWKDVSQRCHGAGPGLRCKLTGTIVVENPATETTAVPFVTAFYLSADDILDENDVFLGTVKVHALEGGKSKKVKLNVKLDAGQNVSGQHIISVLDFFDAVPEVNEANNIVASQPIP